MTRATVQEYSLDCGQGDDERHKDRGEGMKGLGTAVEDPMPAIKLGSMGGSWVSTSENAV